MRLNSVVAGLRKLAPLHLAEKWDNVGLLLEPTCTATLPISLVALTNDLTEKVLDEVIAIKKEKSPDNPVLIVSYHPPIFEAMKKVLSSDFKQRIVLRCVENSIAIYSPHTALDSVEGGVNDWLAEGLGEGTTEIIQTRYEKKYDQPLRLVNYVPTEHADRLRQALAEAGAGRIGNYSSCSFSVEGVGRFLGNEKSSPAVGEKGRLEDVKETRIEVAVSRSQLRDVASVIRNNHPYEEPAWEVYELADEPTNTGQGRVRRLKERVELSVLIDRVKRHLNLKNVRLALGVAHTLETGIQSIALCAGSGGSVVKNVKADVILTGEMSHHEVIAAVHNGSSVILCEHSNTERGYLRVFKEKLAAVLESSVEVVVSETDADPLSVY